MSKQVKRSDVIQRALVDVFVLHDSKLTVSFFYSKEEDILCFVLCYCAPDVLDTMFLLASASSLLGYQGVHTDGSYIQTHWGVYVEGTNMGV